jgi:hypothetical protein
MHEIMVKPLPAGCRLTAIFDCCHSGSSLGQQLSAPCAPIDSEIAFRPSIYVLYRRKDQGAKLGRRHWSRTDGHGSSYAKKDMGGLLKGGLGILRAASGGAQKADEYAKKTRTSPADVVSTCLAATKPVVTSPVSADLLERL